MKLLNLPRLTGKTYHLVRLSIKNNVPIVAYSNAGKDICYYILEINFPDIEKEKLIVYTYEEYLKLENKPKKIYIDEGFEILKKIFNESEIDIVTYSSEDYDKDSI